MWRRSHTKRSRTAGEPNTCARCGTSLRTETDPGAGDGSTPIQVGSGSYLLPGNGRDARGLICTRCGTGYCAACLIEKRPSRPMSACYPASVGCLSCGGYMRPYSGGIPRRPDT
jgi:hypothetical protein